jgi:7-cyano-7-deazaguanine tRNA-ribosyltransferase
VRKDAFFYLSAESARRPEVRRHHDRLGRLEATGDVLVTEGKRAGEYDEIWRLVPPFGPIPPELSDAYPLTAQVPDRTDAEGRYAAAHGVAALVEASPDATITVVHRDWDRRALDALPDDLELRSIPEGPP